ncbi:S-layer homology domain-containing protein [Cohnella faecalis]|uniref:S-layer homology domain-containing protein n=1 Tax=Cohnella faecalis TaxID=2315694 RepID=A0A398CLQ6_9BACL|nr:S-layer homology domain-containing protein [Cohnella faecalis]
MGSHWASGSSISWLRNGLLSGKTESAFAPDEAYTRAEFASLLVKGLGLQDEQGASAFRDVKEPSWYAKTYLSPQGRGC